MASAKPFDDIASNKNPFLLFMYWLMQEILDTIGIQPYEADSAITLGKPSEQEDGKIKRCDLS